MTRGLLQQKVATLRGALLSNREGISRDQGRDCSLPSVPPRSPIYDTDRPSCSSLVGPVEGQEFETNPLELVIAAVPT